MKPYLYPFILFALVCTLSACNRESTFESPEIPTSDINDEQSLNRGYVYTCDKSGSFEIWKFEAEELTQLTDEAQNDLWWPRYSNATDQIIYYRSKSNRDVNDFVDAELWVMNADGNDAKLLIGKGENGWDKQGLADWSHDGEQLIMAAVDPAIGTWQLFLMDVNTTDVTRLTQRDDANYFDPVFDIDDQYIYCVSTPDGYDQSESNHEIFRIAIADGFEERLTYNDRSDHHPYPSPDGSKLVFETLSDPDYLSIGKWSIHELDLASSKEEVVIEDDNINLFPRYSVEGDKIYYNTLSIESFGMKIARYDITSGEMSMLVDDYYNAMNVDPF